MFAKAVGVGWLSLQDTSLPSQDNTTPDSVLNALIPLGAPIY